ILSQFASNVWVAVGVLSLAVAVLQAWAANVLPIASDLFLHQSVSTKVGTGGRAGAIVSIFFYLPVRTLLDSYEGASNIAGGYQLIFTICGLTYLTAWLIIHLLTRNSKTVSIHEIICT